MGESTLGWETDELMIIIMTIMQNTQIIITENHDYLWVWDVSSFLEPHRSIRCPLSGGCVSVTAKLGLCGRRWSSQPSPDSCLLPRVLLGFSLPHPVQGVGRPDGKVRSDGAPLLVPISEPHPHRGHSH